MKAVLDGLSLGLADRDSLVRFQAITGIAEAGKDAAPRLRAALPREPDPTNQAVIVETLGTLKDAVSLPLFIEILGDPRRDERGADGGPRRTRPVPRPAVAARQTVAHLRRKGSAGTGRRRAARPGSHGLSSSQRSRIVHGKPGPRNPGIGALELERQESTSRPTFANPCSTTSATRARPCARRPCSPSCRFSCKPPCRELLELAAQPGSPDYADGRRGPLRPARSPSGRRLPDRAR